MESAAKLAAVAANPPITRDSAEGNHHDRESNHFQHEALEATNANELVIVRATRSVKKDGKEVPAAFKPHYGKVSIPEAIAAETNELVKLAALAGLSAAYNKLVTSKLPTDLLATSGDAEQVVTISEADLIAALRSEGSARNVSRRKQSAQHGTQYKLRRCNAC
jgi:hypothetical protein